MSRPLLKFSGGSVDDYAIFFAGIELDSSLTTFMV